MLSTGIKDFKEVGDPTLIQGITLTLSSQEDLLYLREVLALDMTMPKQQTFSQPRSTKSNSTQPTQNALK